MRCPGPCAGSPADLARCRGPNDEQQADQLDIGYPHKSSPYNSSRCLIAVRHHIFNIMMGGRLYMAPIGDNPRRCLDVGTGTGIWAM